MQISTLNTSLSVSGLDLIILLFIFSLSLPPSDDTSVISEDSRDAAMDAGNRWSFIQRLITKSCNSPISSINHINLFTSFAVSSVSLSSYQAEFHRLSLSCKCDMFTLEKRLRLEERSRDLAEENVCREVSSCQGLLQALIPRCEDDNQAMEIIQRLQKNLEILVQSMTRVSSRSEMLGAIHQESRMGKAVEVMIHHVENLRRTYTKEHTELLELRESLVQNERSFGTERGSTHSLSLARAHTNTNRNVGNRAVFG
uniref:Lymphoid restricted membrane protein n=1 Tax=Electrophorus electricus TaxID=8005 RepID=A0AAY5EVA5_ELEEL